MTVTETACSDTDVRLLILPDHPTPIEELEKECLDEICAICDKYGIYYILHSNVTNLLLLNGTLGPDSRTKAIYMDITAAKQFMEAFAKEQPENRALLSWKNQPYLDRFMLVYTDTGSVCTDFRTYPMTKKKGAHISIVLLRGLKNGIDPKRELLQKEELYLKAVTGRLAPEEEGADAFLSELYKKGTAAMAAELFEEILAADEAADEQGYFFRRISPLTDAKKFMKTTRYAIEEYRYTEMIRVGGRDYRVRQYLKDTFETADQSRLAGTPYSENIFTYQNAHLSWDRLEELVDEARIHTFDWNEIADALADLKAANDAILKIWLQMYSTKDKYDLWKIYHNKIPMLQKLLKRRDLKALKKEMAAYDSTARFYFKNKIHFFINPELTECYVGFLRLLEKDKRADKLARAEKQNSRWMF